MNIYIYILIFHIYVYLYLNLFLLIYLILFANIDIYIPAHEISHQPNKQINNHIQRQVKWRMIANSEGLQHTNEFPYLCGHPTKIMFLHIISVCDACMLTPDRSKCQEQVWQKPLRVLGIL